MILSSLQAEIGRLLADPNNDRWSASVLTSRINEAQTEVQGLTNAVKTKETLTPVVNTRTVALDDDVLDIIRVDITRSDGRVEELPGISREELDFRYPNWQQETNGAPRLYFYDATLNQVNLVPKPDSANAITNGLFVWESRKPADLASASDVPFDSTTTVIPYHMSIVHWVVAQCWMDDGTPEALGKAKFHKSGDIDRPGQFELQIKKINARYDKPTDIPMNILWKPTGGRIGGSVPSKSYPLG